jgi:hypothetical protein
VFDAKSRTMGASMGQFMEIPHGELNESGCELAMVCETREAIKSLLFASAATSESRTPGAHECVRAMDVGGPRCDNRRKSQEEPP